MPGPPPTGPVYVIAQSPQIMPAARRAADVTLAKKFAYQLAFFIITTVIGLIVAKHAKLDEIMLPPDEREAAISAKSAVARLIHAGILSASQAQNLTSHELQIAAHLVEPGALRKGFDDVGGLQHIKRQVASSVLIPLKHSHLFSGDNPLYPRPARGVLLSGPPGTGKTMVARAIAKESGVNFVNVNLSDLSNKFHGESEHLMSAAFSLARKVQPCIIFIDEIDGLAGRRNELDQSHQYGIKVHFLTLLDGLEDDGASIMVLGCTNNARHLDRAMRRRMPVVVEFELPDEAARKDILAAIARNEPMPVPDADLAYAASMSDGMSGSDLDSVYREACMRRMTQLVEGSRSIRGISRDDWDAGLDAVARAMDAHKKVHV